MSEENSKYNSTLYTSGDPVTGIQPSVIPDVIPIEFVSELGSSNVFTLENGLPAWCMTNEFEVQLIGQVSPDGESYLPNWYGESLFDVFFVTSIVQGENPSLIIQDRRTEEFLEEYKIEEFVDTHEGAEWFLHPVKYKALIRPIKSLTAQYDAPLSFVEPEPEPPIPPVSLLLNYEVEDNQLYESDDTEHTTPLTDTTIHTFPKDGTYYITGTIQYTIDEITTQENVAVMVEAEENDTLDMLVGVESGDTNISFVLTREDTQIPVSIDGCTENTTGKTLQVRLECTITKSTVIL